MNYLRIGESKLKITLTQDELSVYGMDLSALDYSSTETRRAFWAILDDAKHATGFDAASGRVCVQIYTSKTGGCEMYVTYAPSIAESSVKSDEQSMALTVCGILPKLYGETVCSFDSLSMLLTACKVLTEQGYNSESSAWQLPSPSGHKAQDLYYLYLAGNRSINDIGHINSSRILAEFGKPMPDIGLGYLSEHCFPLVGDHAVEALSVLAV